MSLAARRRDGEDDDVPPPQANLLPAAMPPLRFPRPEAGVEPVGPMWGWGNGGNDAPNLFEWKNYGTRGVVPKGVDIHTVDAALLSMLKVDYKNIQHTFFFGDPTKRAAGKLPEDRTAIRIRFLKEVLCTTTECDDNYGLVIPEEDENGGINVVSQVDWTKEKSTKYPPFPSGTNMWWAKKCPKDFTVLPGGMCWEGKEGEHTAYRSESSTGGGTGQKDQKDQNPFKLGYVVVFRKGIPIKKGEWNDHSIPAKKDSNKSGDGEGLGAAVTLLGLLTG